MKFVILTDTHLVPEGQTLFSLNPAERLCEAVAHINRDQSDASLIIVTGDLAHWGERAAYERFLAAIEGSKIPIRLMLGNHDKRHAFREIFPSAADDGNGFVQWTETFPSFSMIALDTLDEVGPTHAGLLCEERLAFLKVALEAAPADRPLLLFQHHPPFDVGLPSMDAIKLRNGIEEWQLIEAVGRRPDFMFMGHVHRPISGSWNGIPVHIQRGLAHQVDLDFQADRIPGTLEDPDYSVVIVADGQIIIHQTSYTYDGPRFWLSDQQAQRAASQAELEPR